MRFALLIALLLVARTTFAGDRFDIVTSANRVSIVYAAHDSKLDSIGANLLANDIAAVSGFRPKVGNDITKFSGNVIIIGTIQSPLIRSLNQSYFTQLEGKWECYAQKLLKQPFRNIREALVIAGSDPRGTAYGVFDVSERIGISPWYWWADVQPQKKQPLYINVNTLMSSPPAVKFRGIFINDEDWGLQPWAAKTFEPETGDIGPKTYAKVFELLLRLKANLIWPAMHPSTKAFFFYPGNVTTAEDYQIVVGSSHAEPMLRNNVGEWDEKTMGRFNYITNKQVVHKYWEDRVKESSRIRGMYSLGMRGVHDSQMEGIKTAKEAVPLVEQIFVDQRHLLSKYVNKDLAAVPQVFTAYKEVLEVYDSGLKVPDDVVLVWPDDNYGYIQRLNNKEEQMRKGGGGVYYHASYWGRPHDYLWLGSQHPSLVREEMMKAYETGANTLWVLNVGDIKPLEYTIQQFMDMAFDPTPFRESKYPKRHLLSWLLKTFGNEPGRRIHPILWEYYHLAFSRKPEFMGWSQTEPTTQTRYTDFNHFSFGDEAQKRIDRYSALEAAVKTLRPQIAAKDADAFYQLVYYPMVGASWLNKKFLYRDKSYLYAGQNRLSAYDYADLAKAVYDSIVTETHFYNSQAVSGKWNGIMSMKPRNLPVYLEPVISAISIDSVQDWSIVPEGYVTKDSSLSIEDVPLSLPSFDNLNKQRYFIDIFLSKSRQVSWTAAVSHNWIRLSKSSGSLGPVFGKKEMRIWVDVDWKKLSSQKSTGAITFSAAGKQLNIKLSASKLNAARQGYKGFVENNGYVSMQAAHFTRQVNKSSFHWRPVSDLGYAGDALQALPILLDSKPVTDTHQVKEANSSVEYDFYTYSRATPYVTAFALPTHPVNNNFSVRYAVSIDAGPLRIVDIKTVGRSEVWKQNVLRNRAESRIEMPFMSAGKHTLKLYCVDPGVILDEIRIDLGGLKKAYALIPETKLGGL